MSLPLIFAILSAVCLSVMVVLDSIMMRGCYSGQPRVAYHVTAILGFFFGLILTIIIALTEVDGYWLNIFNQFATQEMLLLTLSGFLTIFSMRFYFELFVPSAGVKVNETAVSMWLTTIPIFVLLLAVLPRMIGSEATLFNIEQILPVLLVFITVGALVKFEGQGENVSLLRSNAAKLIAMVVISVAYLILNEAVLEGLSRSEILSLQPYYWLGFLLGAFGLIAPIERKKFTEGLPRLKKYVIAIVLMEFLGALVYLFEVWSFEELKALQVSLILAGHVLLVFVFALILSTWREKLVGRDGVAVVPGMILDFNELPEVKVNTAKVFWLLASVILLVTTYVLLSQS